MKRKTAERELKKSMNNIGVFTYKFRDRGYISCPTCHRSIVSCPYCRQDMLLEKAAMYPDYLATIDPIFIEVKFGRERYAWDDISPIQRQTLTDNENSWVFLAIGEGRAPDGRAAFLIPWNSYLRAEATSLVDSHKSVVLEKLPRGRVPGARDFWSTYELEWHEGIWVIPINHVWWINNNSIGISDADMERIHGNNAAG
jgi:hypothetical protein